VTPTVVFVFASAALVFASAALVFASAELVFASAELVFVLVALLTDDYCQQTVCAWVCVQGSVALALASAALARLLMPGRVVAATVVHSGCCVIRVHRRHRQHHRHQRTFPS
jgi:hypothetical protein